uniref:Lumbrokinase-P2(2) n=2 Tax=Lumbricus rubellus TaxID=35632 RepID=B8ZZ04_LUMRU|nr:lumbrokinase-P2(2) [Lumbricus rubellus]
MRILLLLCLALPAFGSGVNQHVVGGSDTTIGQYPHQLSLRVTGSHSCGASLIGTTRAVTAAHCTGSAIGVYTILGGTTDRTVTNCATCVLRDLNFLNRHPQYDENGNGYPNDVAVIGFAAVATNTNLQTISLATPSDGSFAGDTGVITGWGKTASIGGIPDILQMATMNVITNADCAGTWGALSINDGHICVSAVGRSACSGDSGGPLECGNTLAGATSWGQASCDPSYPSVYTRISYFYSWIIAQ